MATELDYLVSLCEASNKESCFQSALSQLSAKHPPGRVEFSPEAVKENVNMDGEVRFNNQCG